MENSTLAGFGNRLVAQIIDSLILGFVISVLILPIFGISLFNSSSFADAEDEAAVAVLVGTLVVPLLLAGLLGPILYEAFMVSSSKQATIGKILMKIKVVDEQGQRLTFGAALGRALIKYVTSNVCILLWLWPLFNDKEQALHDIVVKDYVIK
ncbi:hypothetical protein DYBT9275_00632 [Dyadobacter sp. CECT 9275]|uniref:RDD domain-containing protein n=1 Tax=Dyadobacter helix TaxID=2822344 RepID=A0A916JC14_9BACT|nr:RDD family protein [Dyadobacter sp. CECT 9275]CAG4990884.1 hypothetical protein DYBT9275_00632 [Dyadobacter sp. CECT 9275]